VNHCGQMGEVVPFQQLLRDPSGHFTSGSAFLADPPSGILSSGYPRSRIVSVVAFYLRSWLRIACDDSGVWIFVG